MLRMLCGYAWDSQPKTIMYTYKSFIRPVMEYGAVIFAFSSPKALQTLKTIENSATRIAWRLPPWTIQSRLDYYRNFPPIEERIKDLAISFLVKNSEDPFVANLIRQAAVTAKRTPLFDNFYKENPLLLE